MRWISSADPEAKLILVISHPGDDHAVEVHAVLERGGHRAVMVDTAQFPNNSALAIHYEGGRPRYELRIDGQTLDLGSFRVAWWRRPQPFTLAPGMSPDVTSFSYAECHEAMAGLWAALDVKWVNPPARDEVAHHKPYQLVVAAEVGLPIPRTLVTNDPNAARRFVAERGSAPTIYKTFLASLQCWRETRVVRPDELALLDLVRLAPVIFQEYVPAIADIRVTVMGERMFAAAITPAPSGYDIDYRMDMAGASFRPTDLPADTKTKIDRLMKRLGLVYGAIDLRRTPDGAHVFLEVNPAGEWRFVEERTGQPMTAAFAELLVELSRQ
jgi:glutathione synthase/RimK-type ligase-like ATP-grasp enzyme